MRRVVSDLWYDDAAIFRPCARAVVRMVLAGAVGLALGFGPLVLVVMTGQVVKFSGPGSDPVICAVTVGVPFLVATVWRLAGMARGYVAVGKGGIEVRGAVRGYRLGWREVRGLRYARRKGRMSSILVYGGKRSVHVYLREYWKEEAARLEALIRSHVPEGVEEEWGAVCPTGCLESGDCGRGGVSIDRGVFSNRA